MKRLLLIALVLGLLGCWPGGMAEAQTKALILFGGVNHKVFLGCLNCSDISSQSICNGFGNYGSPLNPNSIWDEFGTYGSEFNPFSPWNSFSDNAPIIVDGDGNSYGYFSMNESHHDRTQIPWVLSLFNYQAKSNDLGKTHDYFCGN